MRSLTTIGLDGCITVCLHNTAPQVLRNWYNLLFVSQQNHKSGLVRPRLTIDIISENCHYNEQKLLDGTYGSISKINSTTLGGGTKLGTDVSTSEKAEALKIQYQNAVNMVENEIAKLGV